MILKAIFNGNIKLDEQVESQDPAYKASVEEMDSTKEVQAESVAYVVSEYLGIDTSDYSFGYIAGWSNGRSTEMLKKNTQTISKTVDHIICMLEDLQRKA